MISLCVIWYLCTQEAGSEEGTAAGEFYDTKGPGQKIYKEKKNNQKKKKAHLYNCWL